MAQLHLRSLRSVFVAVVVGSIWASPACKSNEVNQTDNTVNNFQTVGAKGAIIEIPNGPKIRIPADALDRDVEIKITEAEPGEYPATTYPAPGGKGASWTPAGKVWAFEPHGLKFFLDVTVWLPAPDGQYFSWTAQPGGQWEGIPGSSVKPVDGKVEFTTKSFSFYTLQEWGGPGGDDAGPVGPCDACRTACIDRCGGPSGDRPCAEACIATDCARACADAGPGADGGGTGGDTSGCTPMCPPPSATPGTPCTFCGTSYPCTGSDGPYTLNCVCGSGGKLVSCVPTAPDAGSTDTSVTDSDAGMCGGCPSGTVPFRPGETGTPCCKLFGTEVECTSSGASPYMNSCSGTSFICRTGAMGCL